MRKIFHSPVLFLSLGTLWLGSSTFICAQTKDTDPGQTPPYRVEAPGFFPNPFNLYRETPVPPLKLETEFERKLYEAAVMRKNMREEAVRRNREITAGIPDYNTDITD